jgi:hypothetical protein
MERLEVRLGRGHEWNDGDEMGRVRLDGGEERLRATVGADDVGDDCWWARSGWEIFLFFFFGDRPITGQGRCVVPGVVMKVGI